MFMEVGGLNQEQVNLISAVLANFAVGVVLTGVFGPLLQIEMRFEYLQIAVPSGLVGASNLILAVFLKRNK